MVTGAGVKISFRPVKPEDETLMQDFFYSLSERSIYCRFFSHLKFFPLSFLRLFIFVDYRTTMTVIGRVREGEFENIVAVGHYIAEDGATMSEVAMIVRDDWQNRAVGYFLLNYVIRIARGSGLTGFTAEVLKQNAPMIKLLNRAGFTVSPGIGRTFSSAELKFDPAPELVGPDES
jgi:GNAT superfamily N-acetyltransferase